MSIDPANSEAESTGLPGISRWRTVYWLVICTFALWVALLLAVERIFS